MEDSPSRNLAHGEVPLDIILEILSRLPAKSLIRFQSLSKLWFSIIRSKDLAKSFLTYSRTRPRLLFSFDNDDSKKEFICSAPEYDNNTSSVIARHDMTLSGCFFNYSSGPLNGFFCCVRGSYVVVCNPTTKQIVKLPDVPNEKACNTYVKLGYDPVEDEYKVLCVKYTYDIDGNIQVQEHLVCTVRSGEKEEWRKIVTTGRESYTTILDGICIDGVIYFAFARSTKIAQFDVRTEKFDFIQGPRQDYDHLTLINCNGNLGGIKYDSKKMHLWIMEKEECAWNYVTCDVPYEWGVLHFDKQPYFAGEIHTKELLLVAFVFELCKPFSILYCDLIRKSFRRVQVLGLADYEFRSIHGIAKPSRLLFCFPGHIENIMFL